MIDACESLAPETAERLLDLAVSHPAPGTRADLLAILVCVGVPETLRPRLAVTLMDALSVADADLFADLVGTAASSGNPAVVMWVRAFAATPGPRRPVAVEALVDAGDQDVMIELQHLMRSPDAADRAVARRLMGRCRRADDAAARGGADLGGVPGGELAVELGANLGIVRRTGLGAESGAGLGPGPGPGPGPGAEFGARNGAGPAADLGGGGLLANLRATGALSGDVETAAGDSARAGAVPGTPPTGNAARTAGDAASRNGSPSDGSSPGDVFSGVGSSDDATASDEMVSDAMMSDATAPTAAPEESRPTYHGILRVVGSRWFELMQRHPPIHATSLPPERLGPLLVDRLLDSAVAGAGDNGGPTERELHLREWPAEMPSETAVRLARELNGAYLPDRAGLFRRYRLARRGEGPDLAVSAHTLAELAGVGSAAGAVRDLLDALLSPDAQESADAAAFLRTALEQASAARRRGHAAR